MNKARRVNRTARAIPIGTAIIFGVALSGCSPRAAITTAVTTVGGAASTVASAVGGAVGVTGKATGKAAQSVASGRSARAATAGTTATGAQARGLGASGSGVLPPEVAIGATASASSDIGERSEAANEAIGAQVSKRIIAGVLFCSNIEIIEYRIDCFADQLDQVAETVPQDDDFGAARSIISDAATKLSDVAQKRSSRALRPVTLTSSNVAGTGSSRPVVAVQTEELSSAFDEARAVLQEAETLLLRSSETSARRALAYTEMSEAIGSTKILLRSI